MAPRFVIDNHQDVIHQWLKHQDKKKSLIKFPCYISSFICSKKKICYVILNIAEEGHKQNHLKRREVSSILCGPFLQQYTKSRTIK